MKTYERGIMKKQLVLYVEIAIGVVAIVLAISLKRDNTRLSETVKACGGLGREIEEGKTYYFDAKGKQWLIVLEEIE